MATKTSGTDQDTLDALREQVQIKVRIAQIHLDNLVANAPLRYKVEASRRLAVALDELAEIELLEAE
jgi:hypothetical protein